MNRRKRKKQPNEDPSNYRLKVPRAQAAAELEQRIAEGKALCQQQVDPRSDRKMHEFEQAYFAWNKENQEVLYSLYSTSFVRDRLYDAPPFRVGWPVEPQKRYDFIKGEIEGRIKELLDILAGLPMVEDPI